MRPYDRLPGGCPVTWTLIAANALTFVASFVGGAGRLRALIFDPQTVLQAPWTVLTYPLVGSVNILWLLLGSYMLWMFGGSLERGWGKRDYLVFLALVSVATALGMWLGASVTGITAILVGTGMLLAAAVVAWALINPRERLLLYFALPIEARWLAAGSVVLVFFSYPFPLGLFALGGPAVAWWYVRRGRYATLRHGRERPGARITLNPLVLYRRWRLKRQFTRLMRDASAEDEADRGKLH